MNKRTPTSLYLSTVIVCSVSGKRGGKTVRPLQGEQVQPAVGLRGLSGLLQPGAGRC